MAHNVKRIAVVSQYDSQGNYFLPVHISREMGNSGVNYWIETNSNYAHKKLVWRGLNASALSNYVNDTCRYARI